jgi:hypothetical protein
VKLGLFTEKTWPYIKDTLSPSVQSNFILPRDDSVFDTLNSTINYIEQFSVASTSTFLDYVSAALYVGNVGKVFIGGMGSILSIDVITLDILSVGIDLHEYELVRSIIEASDNLYLITEQRIFISNNDGVTWEEYNKSGLPNRFYSIGYISNNLVIGGEDGIYVQSSALSTSDWEKTVSSSSPITVMLSSNVLFTVIDRKIKISSNGYNFTDTGVGENLDINSITRYGYSNTYVSSNQGLYLDNGTFNSLSPVLEAVDLTSLVEEGDTINDVATNSDDLTIIASSNGSYGMISKNTLTVKEISSLNTIHKIVMVGNEIWLFGGGKLKVPSLDYPVRLSTGIPI